MFAPLPALWLLVAPPPPTDLDGDGKPERVEVTPEHIAVGSHRLPREMGNEGPCDVHVVDLLSNDRQRELVLCEHGPRDDRMCALYRYSSKGLQPLKLTRRSPAPDDRPGAIEASGTGVVLARYAGRYTSRTERFVFAKGALEHTPQPFYAVNETFTPNRTFAIVNAPKSKQVLANLKPNAAAKIVAESGDHPDWYLVETSSGLMGWAPGDAITHSSDVLEAKEGAG